MAELAPKKAQNYVRGTQQVHLTDGRCAQTTASSGFAFRTVPGWVPGWGGSSVSEALAAEAQDLALGAQYPCESQVQRL